MPNSVFATLQSPADGAVNIGFHPNFLWDPTPWGGVTAPDRFEIQVAEDSSFALIVVDASIEIARYVPANVRLTSNKQYFWRVRCLNRNTVGSWSEGFNFRVANFAHYVVEITASDTVADVRSKFALAKTNRPATVRLAENVSWETPDAEVLPLVAYSNIWFDGNGKTITITNPANRLFHITNSSTNVILSDFKVDYDPLPYVLCEITALDALNNRLTVKTINNAANPCLELNDPRMLNAEKTHMRLLDKGTPGRIAYDSPTYILDGRQTYVASYLSGGTLYHVIQLASPFFTTADFAIGDYMLRVARGDSNNIVRTASSSTDICLDNITAYSSPGQFASSIDGSRFIVVNCKTALKPGRYCSVTADCVYVRRNEIGPWVENCQFTANGDDCMNFHSVAAGITSKIDNFTVGLNVPLTVSRFAIGDEVAIWDPYPGTTAPIYTTVTAKDTTALTITVGADVGTLDLSDADPERRSGVFNLTKNNRRFYVGNSVVTNNARFGLLLSGQDGEVVGNLFDGCASSAVRIGDVPSEGLNARDILFRNNKCANSGYQAAYFDDNDGVITINSYGTGWTEVPWKLHDNITFVNNAISGWESAAVKIRACSNVLFDNNYISDGGLTSFPNPGSQNDVMVVSAAAGVRISNTALDEQRIASPAVRNDGGNAGLNISPFIVALPSLADGDGDGIPDFLGFAFGVSPFAAAMTGLPSLTRPDGAGAFELRFVRPAGRQALRYTAEVSSNLTDWTAGHSYGPGAFTPPTPPTEELEHVTMADGSEVIRLRVPLDPVAKKRFARVRVANP